MNQCNEKSALVTNGPKKDTHWWNAAPPIDSEHLKNFKSNSRLQKIWFLIITSSCLTLKSFIHAYRKQVLCNTEIWSLHWPLLVAPSWFLAPWYPGRWRGGGDSWSLVQPLLCFWSSRRGTTTDRCRQIMAEKEITTHTTGRI